MTKKVYSLVQKSIGGLMINQFLFETKNEADRLKNVLEKQLTATGLISKFVVNEMKVHEYAEEVIPKS